MTYIRTLSNKIKFTAFKYYYKFRSSKIFSYLINKSGITIINNLKKDKAIKFCRPDKGRGVAVLNGNDYVSKVKNILSDEFRFHQINIDPVKLSLKLEDKLNRFMRKLHKNNKLTNDECKEVYSRGSSSRILYSLPKTHKTNLPIHPSTLTSTISQISGLDYFAFCNERSYYKKTHSISKNLSRIYN